MTDPYFLSVTLFMKTIQSMLGISRSNNDAVPTKRGAFGEELARDEVVAGGWLFA